jgi:hypothetical protein
VRLVNFFGAICGFVEICDHRRRDEQVAALALRAEFRAADE